MSVRGRCVEFMRESGRNQVKNVRQFFDGVLTIL